MSALGDQLKMFTAGVDDDFIVPDMVVEEEEEVIVSSEEDDEESLSRLAQIMDKGHPNKKKDSDDKRKRPNLKFVDDEEASDVFDFMMDSFDEDDEDIELKNQLVSLGRKYARETGVSAETSEIVKMYSGNEKRLENLMREIRRDKEELTRDVSELNAVRGRSRNYKAITELREVQKGFHEMELSAIKEMNNMKKVQYELQLKAKANQKDNADANTMNGNLISNLFSLGRKNVLGAGYTSVSGASSDDYTETDDEAIVAGPTVTSGSSSSPSLNSITNPEPDIDAFDDEEETDADKFLKYENSGAHYVLLLSPEGHRQGVIAEDRDGNYLPDYPMPTDVESLNFNIDTKLGTATDDFHREYEVRYEE